MAGKKHVATQIRLPEAVYTQAKELSETTGDSLNGTLLHLVYWGLKVCNSDVILPIQKE